MTRLAGPTAGRELLARLEAAEAELASLRRELDHTHQLATLGTLAAGIAHEINNILTPVLAYAQLAGANPDDTTLRAKALDRAIAGVESAARITEAVLGFARNDDEGEQADIAAVAEAALACLGRDPARDGIVVSIDVPEGLSVAIRPLALQQVFLNLILNAVAVLEQRGGCLRISAAPAAATAVTIVVEDTGPGVPAEVAARLFEPFVSSRSQRRGRSAHGGSGLGLAVCRRLVQDAGGTISLRAGSVDDGSGRRGAAFTISLPRASATQS